MPSERKNISQPADRWQAWERAAAEKGLNLSEWIEWACNRALPKAIRDRLTPRVKQGKPKTKP